MIAMLRCGIAGLALLLIGMSAAGAIDNKITLSLGNNATILLDRPFETVIIGSPDIVDVHSGSDRTVILEPLRYGASNVIFVDKDSVVIANVRVFVCNAIRGAFRQGSDCD